jgi:signal transduction histidine kinase
MSRSPSTTKDRTEMLRVVKPAPRDKAARRSLSFYLIILIALQSLSLFGFIGSVSLNDFRQARNAATERTAEDSRKAATLIDASIKAGGRALESEAALPGYAAVFDDPSRCTVTSSGSEVFTTGEFHVLRADGSVACTSAKVATEATRRGYRGQSWLASVPGAVDPVVAGPLTDPVTQRPAVIVAVPIVEVPGAVVLSLDLAGLNAGLRSELGDRVPPSSFLVTSSDRSSELVRTTKGSEDPLPAAFTAPVKEGMTATSFDGIERVHAESTVPGMGWHVIAAISTAETYNHAWHAIKERVLFAAVIMLVVCAVGWLINRRVARPIRALAGAVEQAAAEGGPLVVPEDGPKEVRGLGRRFNRLLRERAEKEIGLVEMFPSERREGGRREIDRIKSAFLMAVSHELRTPLAVVTGYAEVLEEQMADLSNQEAVEIAHQISLGAGRLERILLDILDVEKMSRGVFEADRRATHLRDLVTRVLELTDHRGDVRVNVPKGLVAEIDSGLMERILDNLIRNALKHTPAGTPLWVSASLDGGELELIVEDAGPGIPDELKPEIFEPFTQGDTPSHSPGTGIGLSLVAQFARLHGGRAWVDDRPGGGARFHVTFTEAQPHAKRPKVKAKAS